MHSQDAHYAEQLASQSRLADRFQIQAAVEGGGMGKLYRALDEHSGQLVALKVVVASSTDSTAWSSIVREAELLAVLSHPGIVRYIAHGETATGTRYLATEWLPGETLEERLRRQPLDLAESVLLLRRICEALNVAHRLGIVHRDLKPGNLFLRDGLIDRTTLLDFGIATRTQAAATVEPAGGAGSYELCGTANYMAPELVRGERSLGPGADIFALGCVFFECLHGQPPFASEHQSGVLARILFDEPLSIHQAQQRLPSAVVSLLSRMLAKEPAERPTSAAELLTELAVVERALGSLSVPLDSPPATLTTSEQRLAIALLTKAPDKTLWSTPQSIAALRDLLTPWGAQVERLADGALIASSLRADEKEATDQAEQLLRCALQIKERWPTAAVVLTTSREGQGGAAKIGEAVDRALGLLARSTVWEYGAKVILDEGTTGLIGVSFDVVPCDGKWFTVAFELEEERADRTRLLLGKPTPCVGRQQDLSLLETTLAFCRENSAARLMLVSAPPGIGKSRLRHEFVRRLRARSRLLQIWFGRGDPMRAGSPYHLAAQAVRRRYGIRDRDDASSQQVKLLVAARARMPSPSAERVAAFLGELCGIAFPEEACEQLAGARQNPRTMNAQVTRAWLDVLWAETERQPLLLIFEDLHWGDALSVGLIHAALRELSDRPLMVLLLGRPEMEVLFPSLLQAPNVRALRLGRLSDQASERLVRHALGADVEAERVAQIVQHAGGNALYLEELIRTLFDSERQDLPDSILAMLEGRLMRLHPRLRRILRAASIFGERFDLDGLAELLGRHNSVEDIEKWLGELLASEMIERSVDVSGRARNRFHFRHGLIREAAYQMLTSDDRLLGHLLAAKHLETTGELDARVLAEHYRRGGQQGRAASLYLASARRALANSDLASALSDADQALACGLDASLVGELRAVQLQAHFWHDDWAQALPAGHEAMRGLQMGSETWFRAAAILLPTTALRGDIAAFSALAGGIAASQPAQCARAAYFQAAGYLAVMMSLLGQREMSASLLGRLRQELASAANDPVAQGYYLFGELVHLRMLCADPWQNYVVAEAATRVTEQTGELRTLLFVKGFLGIALAELGDFTAADRVFSECLKLAERLREPLLITHVKVQHELGLLIENNPARRAETLASAQRTVDNERVNPLLRGEALINLASAQRQSGLLQKAENSARAACELLVPVPEDQLLAQEVLIRCLIDSGRGEEAQGLLQAGLAQLASRGGGYAEVMFRLACVDGLLCVGDQAGARTALRDARHALEVRAQTIPEPSLRERYLHRISHHVRIQELARLWLEP